MTLGRKVGGVLLWEVTQEAEGIGLENREG